MLCAERIRIHNSKLRHASAVFTAADICYSAGTGCGRASEASYYRIVHLYYKVTRGQLGMRRHMDIGSGPGSHRPSRAPPAHGTTNASTAGGCLEYRNASATLLKDSARGTFSTGPCRLPIQLGAASEKATSAHNRAQASPAVPRNDGGKADHRVNKGERISAILSRARESNADRGPRLGT